MVYGSIVSCLTDPSLSLEYVTKTTEIMDEESLGAVLYVPPRSKRRDGRSKMIEYFLNYSHKDSWSDLAGGLYALDRQSTLSELREFVKGTTGVCV